MSNQKDTRGTSASRRNFFGPGLRQTRERGRLSDEQFVAALSREGYELSVQNYRCVESGEVLPDRAAQFLRALAHALPLDPAETHDLEDRLAYDILFARLGERTDLVLPPKAHWLS